MKCRPRRWQTAPDCLSSSPAIGGGSLRTAIPFEVRLEHHSTTWSSTGSPCSSGQASTYTRALTRVTKSRHLRLTARSRSVRAVAWHRACCQLGSATPSPDDDFHGRDSSREPRHPHVLVFSHHSQPYEAKWKEIVKAAREHDLDPRNAGAAWTPPQDTKRSGRWEIWASPHCQSGNTLVQSLCSRRPAHRPHKDLEEKASWQT